MKVLSVRKMKKWGYEIRTEEYDGNQFGLDKPFMIKSAYTPNGDYIGSSKDAYRLCKTKGIVPELSNKTHNTCSIGFCDKENKWYGWSHRAIYGFTIGSTCKKGDIHYISDNKYDFARQCTEFWTDEYRLNVTSKEITEIDGSTSIHTSWEYSDTIPNKKLRKTITGVSTEYPKVWGRGEWIAKTMEDAKQMAIDFANGVS